MTRSRTSTLWLALWGVLVFHGFRPIAPLGRVLELALAPLRVAAMLGSPLGLLRQRSVAAAERELARAARAEAEEGAELLARLAERALPGEPSLRSGRGFVSAEVLERASRDECWVALESSRGVEPGSPVVCGDAFVGRVLELSPPLARVQLVTAGSFRVGAVVRGGEDEGAEPVYLTVGGVRAPRRRSQGRTVRLAAHQPSSSALAGGVARVHELFADAGESARLAEGFHLGELRREGERGEPWIEPELDYLDGLFHVAIVVPAASGDAVEPAAAALMDGRWLATRALTFGDPTPWRSTLKIPLGRESELGAGAAVTGAGARLIGRVSRVGLTTSDVALLSDPGFTLAALARLEGSPEPIVLGRLTALGRGAEGTIRLRWCVRVPLALEAGAESSGGDSVRARLFSGPGDPGLPGGLFLGTVRLPRRASAGEELELELEPGIDPQDVRRLFVRQAVEGARP